MKFKCQLDSTRFTYIQEALGIGLFTFIMKSAVWHDAPLIEFLTGFVLPLVGIAFGFKTFGDIQENKNETTKDKTDLPLR
jgi:hypothetical protein